MSRIGLALAATILAAVGTGCSPDSDRTANGAQAGTGGSGLSAGVGGIPGAASGGSTGQPVSPETILRAAVVVGSCIEDDGISRNLSNMYDSITVPEFYSRWGMQTECLATTGGGCRAVEQCLGYSVDSYSGDCEPCNGTVAVYCANGYRVQLDCSKIGLQCDPAAFCTDEVPAIPCDEDSFVRTCTTDGRPQHCSGTTVVTGPPCSQLGLDCVDGQCVGTGEPCQGSIPASDGRINFDGFACEGQTLVACVEGRTQRRDCTTVRPDFSCQSYNGSFFCGLSSQCAPRSGVVCEATEVVVCNAGQIARVDCTDLGFTGCDVDTEYGCTPGFTVE